MAELTSDEKRDVARAIETVLNERLGQRQGFVLLFGAEGSYHMDYVSNMPRTEVMADLETAMAAIKAASHDA